jgi:hypothetical protein
LDGYRKKGYSKTSTHLAVASSNPVFFMDDFAGDADGAKPAGWYFSTYGKHSKVATIKNKPGRWVQLGYGNPVSPTGIRKPLPQNFTVEYDVATDDFTSRTGGGTLLYLSTYPLNKDGTEDKSGGGTFINLTITAGNEADYDNNNYRGEMQIEVHTSSGVNIDNGSEGTYFKYATREFTNHQSKVQVAFQVNNGEIKLSINDKQVARSADFTMTYGKPCISCRLPANARFNTIHWKNTTNDAENVNVYISNIRMTKD